MEENKYRTTSILVTIGFHALLVLILFIMPAFTTDALVGSEGIEVALGTDIEGGNTGTMADAGTQNPIPPPPQQVSGDNSEQDVATDENSESKIVVPEKKVEKKKKINPVIKTTPTTATTTTQTETKVPERKADPNSTYTKKKGTANGNEGGDPNSTGYGGGNKTGNKGDPTGNPNGNPEGKGGGVTDFKLPGAHLKGRSPKSQPSIDNNFKEEGLLVFKIVVNREGKVIEITKVPPSTITDYNQIQKAKASVKQQLEFNAKPDADEEQTGYFTIQYKKK
jgi:hypothetical protein